MKTYLNLGCGQRFDPAWTNIDIAPNTPGVIQHDLSEGIPLPDASCDVVYNAAVLEHLRPRDVMSFLCECYRVLKVGGIIRVGVPDLEVLCRLYLSKLQGACNGDRAAANDYEWIMLELYDQYTREEGGGAMVEYLRRNPLTNEEFVYGRVGEEGRRLVKVLRNRVYSSNLSQAPLQGMLVLFCNFIREIPLLLNHLLLRILVGDDGIKALEIGRFRLRGEVHHWAYDRYSLARLLEASGFHDPIVKNAAESQIDQWTSFNLDTHPDGRVLKPDLFFMEAIK